MLRTLQFKKFKRTLKNQTLPPLKQTFKKKGKINLGHFSLKIKKFLLFGRRLLISSKKKKNSIRSA